MLHTRAETSGYTETSLHADVMAFVQGLRDRNDRRLVVRSFGASPQGRDLPLLILSKDGLSTPDEARHSGRPIVLIMDGIHPGEVEGKEASLALVRDLLDGKHPHWLDDLVLLVVPLFNPDGNDALDPVNRRLDLKTLTGQPGPVVGTRTQSHGINLNRDYMRQAAPEMRSLQSNVAQPWAAHLTLDNHATNGSVHRFHMTVDVPHTIESGRHEPIALVRDRLVPEVTAAVRGHGFDSGWYGNFVEDERQLEQAGEVDPEHPVGLGWVTYPHHPRFGANYRGLTGRLDLLLECYSYLSFEERVRTASAWQIETLTWACRNKEDVLRTVERSRMPPPRVAVRYQLQPTDTPVEILTRTPRTLEGAPSSVTIPHHARFVGTTVVDRPAAYLVPPSMATRLRAHGLRVDAASGEADVEVAEITGVGSEGGRAILEAARFGDVSVGWKRETRKVPEGWSSVRTEQPLGAIAVYLCEPESDDGAVENGVLPAVAVGEEFGIWRVRG